ncbi:MAG TPA: hypothetical protein VMT52_05150, partial [Planctomycetota bacterium]|nr:hypothetical protein [Planctomycetota bacterium]
TAEQSEYRLDPFLFRVSSGPETRGIGGLFELFAYDRRGPESSFRIIPLVFGYSREDTSALGIIPFHYQKDFGKHEIDYLVPWRFLFLTHSLRGSNGERHFGVLWRLFAHTDNPNRPKFHETSLLYGLFLNRRTETSRQLQVNPFFSYYHDETADETRYSVMLSLYSYHKVRGRATHRIFFISL